MSKSTPSQKSLPAESGVGALLVLVLFTYIVPAQQLVKVLLLEALDGREAIRLRRDGLGERLHVRQPVDGDDLEHVVRLVAERLHGRVKAQRARAAIAPTPPRQSPVSVVLKGGWWRACAYRLALAMMTLNLGGTLGSGRVSMKRDMMTCRLRDRHALRIAKRARSTK